MSIIYPGWVETTAFKYVRQHWWPYQVCWLIKGGGDQTKRSSLFFTISEFNFRYISFARNSLVYWCSQLVVGPGSSSKQTAPANPPAAKPAAYRPPHAKTSAAIQAEVCANTAQYLGSWMFRFLIALPVISVSVVICITIADPAKSFACIRVN